MTADERGSVPAAASGPAPSAEVRTVRLASAVDFAGFRRACRQLWSEQVAPDRVVWQSVDDAESDLFESERAAAPGRCRRRVDAGSCGPCAGRVPAPRRERDPARRSGALRPALSTALATPGRARPARRSARPRLAARRPDGAGGAPRHAQDEDVRPLPHDRRARRRRRDRRAAARRLVRARAPHRRGDRAVLRAPLHGDALGDPDARAQRPLGRRRARLRPRCAARPGACAGRRRAALARQLPQHLQPGTAQAADDAGRNAEARLEEPCRGAADRPAWPARPANGACP